MSIRKNKNGSYTADVYDSNGRRIMKVFKIKTDAVDYERKINNEKREIKLYNYGLKLPEVTFESAVEEFKSTKSNLSPKTVQKYNMILNQFLHFTEELNIKCVSQFSPDDASLLLNTLKKEKHITESNRTISPKPKTVNAYLLVIKAFFQEEVIKGHIVKSPMLHIKNQKIEKRKPEYYTKEELKLFFKQEMDDSERLAFMGLYYTGMRINELANITWNDIDFDKKLISITEKDNFKAKTHNSYREIPIPKNLLNMLIKESKDKKSAIYVFASKNGCKLHDRRLLERCKEIAKKAKLSGNAYLHKFRHTYASLLVINRVPIERVQKLLGHSSISETLVYAHLSPDTMHEDVSVLNNNNIVN